MKIQLDDKVMDVDEDFKISICDRCILTFPLCMTKGEQILCGKRVREVMERLFID